jgi:hypothetical protein
MKIYALNTLKRRGITTVLAIALAFLFINNVLPTLRSMYRDDFLRMQLHGEARSTVCCFVVYNLAVDADGSLFQILRTKEAGESVPYAGQWLVNIPQHWRQSSSTA